MDTVHVATCFIPKREIEFKKITNKSFRCKMRQRFENVSLRETRITSDVSLYHLERNF